MRSRIAALMLTASLFAAAPLQAQTQQFTFNNVGAGYTAYGYYVGTFGGTQGTGSTAQSVGLNCVDFFHHVSIGQTWTANVTGLGGGSIANTLHPTSLAIYQQAAWLISQETSSNVAAIQGTIWNLFSPAPGIPSSATWLAAAQATHVGFNYSNWYVVTDVNKTSTGVQEFIMYQPGSTTTTTPEPASMVLFGSGLLGLAGVRLRRKNGRR